MKLMRAGVRNPLIPGAAAALVALALLAACAPADATVVRRSHARARQHAAAAPTAATATPGTAGAQGLVVAVDPETGRLGLPSADQMLLLSPSERTGLMRTTTGLVAVRLPNGAMMINLQGRFMDYSVVGIDSCGRPRLGCVDDAGALSRWLDAGAPAPAPTPVLEVK